MKPQMLNKQNCTQQKKIKILLQYGITNHICKLLHL